MTTRNLCEIYILLRNNSIQTKSFFKHELSDDRVSLVTRDKDIEIGEQELSTVPKWLDLVEEVDFDISKIKSKIKELDGLHQQQANRPTFEENTILDHEIQTKGHQIIQMLGHSQSLVKRISSQPSLGLSPHMPSKESALRKNISSHLLTTLCDLTSSFRRSQSMYLKRNKCMSSYTNFASTNSKQIERREVYMTSGDYMVRKVDRHPLGPSNDMSTLVASSQNDRVHGLSPNNNRDGDENVSYPAIMKEEVLDEDEVLVRQQRIIAPNTKTKATSWNTTSVYNLENDDPELTPLDNGLDYPSSGTLLLQRFKKPSSNIPFFLEDDAHSIQREGEIKSIVKSIIDLNVLFRDLSQIIVDQGTIVDRIDYNLEQSSVTVKTGLKQLQKAESYQRKNRKIVCLMVLAATVVVMSIALVVLKF